METPFSPQHVVYDTDLTPSRNILVESSISKKKCHCTNTKKRIINPALIHTRFTVQYSPINQPHARHHPTVALFLFRHSSSQLASSQLGTFDRPSTNRITFVLGVPPKPGECCGTPSATKVSRSNHPACRHVRYCMHMGVLERKTRNKPGRNSRRDGVARIWTMV